MMMMLRVIYLATVLMVAWQQHSVDGRFQQRRIDTNSTRSPVLRRACDLLYFTTHLAECRVDSRVVTSSKECWKVGCCYHHGCFQKPVRCYVDLRKEKCFRTPEPGGSKDFVSGYSATGSHCYSLHHNQQNRFLQKLYNFIPGRGFPVSTATSGGHCTMTWIYKVTEHQTSPDKCMIHVYNSTLPLSREHRPVRTSEGRLFKQMCIKVANKFRFQATHMNVNITECVCRIDAWLEAPQEQLRVSSQIQHYLDNSNSTILKNFNQTSWNERVKIVNYQEMSQVVQALKSISKVSDQLEAYDTVILLDNIKKVANFDYDTSFGNLSANNMIQDAAFITGNLLAQTIAIENQQQSNKKGQHGGHVVVKRDVIESGVMDTYRVKMELFKVFENITNKVAMNLDKEIKKSGYEQTIKQNGIDFKIKVQNSQNLTLLQSHSSQRRGKDSPNQARIVEIPEKDLAGTESITMMSVFYQDQVSQLRKDVARVSDYLSIHVQGSSQQGIPRSISVPVQFTLQHPPKKLWQVSCAFLRDGDNQPDKERWSEYGCKVTNSFETNTTCSCNHTTHFALLMKFTGTKLPDGHAMALEMISHGLGAVSSLLLVATLSVFVRYRRKLLKERMVIHFHLIIALLGGYISITIASFHISPRPIYVSNTCIVFAYLTHVFYLAVFFWSLVEGLYLFYKIVLVFQKRFLDKLTKLSPLIGWGCSIAIASASLIASRTTWFKPTTDFIPAQHVNGVWIPPSKVVEDGYVNPKTCFLSTSNGMIWTFLAPVLIVTAINFVILIKIAHIIYLSSSSAISNRRSSGTASAAANLTTNAIKQSAKGAMFLMPILSIPWIIGLLYDLYEEGSEDEMRVILGTTGAYLQVIFAGVQGILIFFFYCLYNSEVKSAHNLAVRKRKSIASQGRSSSSFGPNSQRRLFPNNRKLSNLFNWRSVRTESVYSNKSTTEMATLKRTVVCNEAQRKESRSTGAVYLGRFPLSTFGQGGSEYTSGRNSSQETLVDTSTACSTLERR